MQSDAAAFGEDGKVIDYFLEYKGKIRLQGRALVKAFITLLGTQSCFLTTSCMPANVLSGSVTWAGLGNNAVYL